MVKTHELSYGYVLWRSDENPSWWHAHLVRSNVEYQSELLGKRTNLLLAIQRFNPGVLAASPQFLLTLDGEGVQLAGRDIRVNGDWAEYCTCPEREREVNDLESFAMPRILKTIEGAFWHLVRHGEYERVCDPADLVNVEVE